MELTTQITPEIKAKLEARQRARTDKLYLANEVLGYTFEPDVHAELFASFIGFDSTKPYVFQSEHKKRLVLWSRGHYKTTAVVVEVIQTILNFPDVSILFMQGGLANSKERLAEIASHFTGQANHSKLTELFPEFCGQAKELKLNSSRFTTPARKEKQSPAPTVSVASPKALSTGRHFDVGFFDDIINNSNSSNNRLLMKAEKEFNAYIPLIKPGGYFYVTGTRYAFGDLYENIIRQNELSQEWVISIRDCWAEDRVTPRFLQRINKYGQPHGFTAEMLLNWQRTDPGMFSSQYLLRPIGDGQQLFHEQMLVEAITLDPLALTGLGKTILFIDCATTDAEYSDDSVIIAGQVDSSGCMYVTDIEGDRWLPEAFANHVLAMTLKHRPWKVMIEKSASGIYMEYSLRMIARQAGVNLPLELLTIKNVDGAKNMRISLLRNYFMNRRLRFFPGLKQWDKLVQQFEQVPKGKHDDYPDTIALMVGELSHHNLPVNPTNQARHTIFQRITEEQAYSRHLLEQNSPETDTGGCGSDFA